MQFIPLFLFTVMLASVASATPIVLYDENNNPIGTATNPLKATVVGGGASQWDNGADSAIYYNDGNVGIGSASPRGKLDVDGGIYAEGISTKTWVNPVIEFHASGSVATTTGTISSGSNSLAVASADGWEIGMGIAIANAGTGGTTELITSVTNISGTTFTLADNAFADATNQTVNHDDTVALQAALNSDRNVILPAGGFNITSTLTLSKLKSVIGSGFSTRESQVETSRYTYINYRKTTGNAITISTGYVQVRNLSIVVPSSITHTSGFGIEITTSGATTDRWHNLSDLLIYNFNGGLKLTTSISFAQFYNITIGIRNGSSSHGIYYNNASPAGDNRFNNIDIRPVLSGTYTGYGFTIVNADTFSMHQVKTIGGKNGLYINGGEVFNVRLTNCSFENSDDYSVLLDSSNIHSLTIVGCEMGVSVGGIYIKSASTGGYISLIGNIISAATTGIKIDAVTQTINLVGNSYHSVSTQLSKNAAAINVNIVGQSPYTLMGVGTQNVGIGTITPRAKLQVDGSIYIPSANLTRVSALCMDETGVMGHCSSAVGADGTCTCEPN